MDSSHYFSQYDDVDPGYSYHQDYYKADRGTLHLPILLVLGVALLSTFLFQTPYRPDFSLQSIQQSLWDFAVHITPQSLLELLDRDGALDSLPLLKSAATQSSVSTHDLKSEKMRRVLCLDKGPGLMGSVTQASIRTSSLLTKEEVPAGLGNWDNSCYQNSVLQGLASLDSLPKYLAGPMEQPDCRYERGRCSLEMAGTLMELIAQLRDPANNGKRIWTPAILKNMSSFQQQDAQEYFSKVMDEIDKEIAKATIAAVDVGTQTARENGESSNIATAALTSTRNPLEGMLAQRVGCTTCGFSEGLSMIPFNCLTVPIGRDQVYDISECLDAYTTLERIEGVECGKCTLLKNQSLLKCVIERSASYPVANKGGSYRRRLDAVTKALEEHDYDEKTLREKCDIPAKNRVNTIKTRQAVIARPPKSLVIHINRSLFDETTGDLRKNYAQVRFPKTLDLGPWSLGSHASEENIDTEQWLLDPARSMIASSMRTSRLYGPIYELRAVLTHYGRHENGHYVCYRKHPTTLHVEKRLEDGKDAWWRLSDDDVMKVTEQDLLDQGGVFMLFYDRVSTSLPSPLEASTPVLEKIAPSVDETRSRAAGVILPASPASPASSNIETASDDGEPDVPEALTPILETIAQSVDGIRSCAAGTSLPAPPASSDIEYASDDGDPDVPTSVSMSREPSHTNSDSGDEQTSRTEQAYEGPVKPIMINPFIQSHGYRDDNEDGNMTVAGTMGRSSSRSSSLLMV